jgi:hypothetical protein
VEFCASGGRGHIDFGEQFPYDPDQGQGLLTEAGFDQRNPLSYSMMTYGTEGAFPTIATIMKTPYAKLRLEVTVGIINRTIFLQRLTKHRDWEQAVNLTGAALDPYSRPIDTRTGNNTITQGDKHHDDKHCGYIGRSRQGGGDGLVGQAVKKPS